MESFESTQSKKSKKEVQSFDISKAEEAKKDTYEQVDRITKEKGIFEEEIKEHWEARAQRPDVQAVMSARHNLEENKRAAEELKKDIFENFLDKNLLEGKRIFELGVGVARMTPELAKQAKKVVGVDISSTMLEKAKKELEGYSNVELRLGKITDLNFPPKSFDLVFESIVLLHILNPEELKQTVEKMKELSDKIFLAEHVYDPEQPDLPPSKFSIFRKTKEYKELFEPYKLIKHNITSCAGDRFDLMLFENLESKQ